MKTVLVTGGASGLGLSIIKEFLDNKWNVVMADVNEEKGKEIEMELKKKYVFDRLFFCKTDLADSKSVANLYEKSIEKYKNIDVIINNAGIFVKGALHEVAEEDWDRVIDVNLKSIYLVTKYFVPDMIKHKEGAIINTASVSGMLGDYNMAAYSASKGAVVNLVRSMALDYARYGIRVNNIIPGPMNTEMFQKNPKKVIDQFKKASPLGDIAQPDDIAKIVYYLADNNATKAITGQNIPVTSGFGIYTGQPVQ